MATYLWIQANKIWSTSPPNSRIERDPASQGKEHADGEAVGDDGDQTPKAKPVTVTAPVPSFSLNGKNESDSDSEDEEKSMPPPSFPAMNSAQRAKGGMRPPQKPPTLKPLVNGIQTNGGLMAPPPRPMLSTRPNPIAGLRAPAGPLPNRGPPANSSASLGVLGTTATRTPNPRAKVLLSPGHSPLDWATLTKSGKNLSGVGSLVRVTPAMLKKKNGRKGGPAWSSYQGKVYNISPYLPFHPGGEGELRRAAGKDGGKLFHDVHPWVNWENMLGECLVGVMVSEGDGDVRSELDDMD